MADEAAENPFGDMFAEAEKQHQREQDAMRKARRKRAKQRRFLAAFVTCGCIDQAARDTGVDRDNHYRWIAQEPEYAADFQVSQQLAFELLRSQTELAAKFLVKDAFRKVIIGESRKKFTAKGLPVIDPATGKQYVEFEKSERLHIELLKRYDPEFRNSVSITQQVGVRIEERIHGDTELMDASIQPPAEAMRRAIAAAAVKQIESSGGTNGNGNGHANGNGNGNGHANHESG